MHWGDTWLSAEAGGPPPAVLTHTRCGHDITGPVLCPGCHQPVDPSEITVTAGPGSQ